MGATGKALSHMAGLLAKSPDTCLPAIRTMAAGAGVSALTMWRAVQALKAQGVVEVKHGSGIYRAGQGPRPAVLPRRKPLPWEQACEKLAADVAAGACRCPPALPTLKEMAGRYGVVPRTMRRAVEALVADGLVAAAGRRYRLSASARRSVDTVVLVGRGAPDGSLVLPTPRMEQQLRVLEEECARAGVRLKAIGAERGARRLAFTPEASAYLGGKVRAESVLGYLIWTTSLLVPAVVSLVRSLVPGGRPVSLLDEGGEFSTGSGELARPGLAVFSVSNSPGSGLEVSRYLRSLGHRHIAYVTLWPGVRWSENRLDGLRRGLGPGSEVCVYAPAEERRDYVPGLAAVEQALARVSARAGQGRRESQVQRALAASGDYAQGLIARQERQAHAAELFGQALAGGGASAWVAANDELAVAALDFLRSGKRRVPEDLSVAGFDDTPEAFSRELTSYNFNVSAVAHAMIYHILEPRAPSRRTPRVVELKGFVSERRTTATVTRAGP